MSPCPRWTAIPLGRASRRASRDQPGRQGGNALASRGPWFPISAPPAAPIRSCSRWGLPCRPRYRGRGALLPHRFTLACCERSISGRPEPAVCFLWHFPWGRPRRRLAGTVFPWSPDFPPMLSATPANRRAKAEHISGRPAVWQESNARAGASGQCLAAMRRLGLAAMRRLGLAAMPRLGPVSKVGDREQAGQGAGIGPAGDGLGPPVALKGAQHGG